MIARLAVLFAVAALFRLLYLGREGFWYDEIVAFNIAQQPFSAILSGIARDGGNPQGFWLIGKIWTMLVGDGEAALRLSAALFGIAAPVLLYLLARTQFDEESCFLAALLLACNPNHIYMSQEFRPYTIGVLACIGLLLFAVKYWTEGKQSALVGYILCCVVGLYNFYYTALPMIGIFAWAISTRPRSVQFRNWVIAHVVICVAYIPGLLVFADQYLYRSRSVVGVPNTSWLHLGASPLTLLFGRTLVWKEDGQLFFALAVLVCTATICALGWLWWRRYPGKAKAMVLCAALVPLTLVAVLTAIKNMHAWDDRKALFILVPVLLIVAQGLSVLAPPAKRVVFGLMLVLSVVANYRFYTNENRDDWRGVSQQILSQLRDGDAIGVVHADELESLAFYLRRATTLPATQVQVFGFAPELGKFVDVRQINQLSLSTKGSLPQTDTPFQADSAKRVWVVSLVRRGEEAVAAPAFRERLGASNVSMTTPVGQRLVLRLFTK
jgi:uncharacterized membrane protein